MDSPFIVLENVVKEYRLGEKTLRALKGVSFSVRRGEFLALVGSSGSGKTTILNLIGCIDSPTSGSVQLNGQLTSALDDNQLSDFRAMNLGYVFQTFNLIPVLTAFENVEYPLLRSKLAAPVVRKKVLHALEQVGLADFVHHRPDQLSGGQRQRVAIARALVHDPKLVVADEPTANLDLATTTEILQTMKRLNSELGVTFIFSTHDPLVEKSAGRVIKVYDGAIRV